MTNKVLKGEPSLLYATHSHDLFYITVMYHQNIPNSIQVIERTVKSLQTAGCQAHRYISKLFGQRIKTKILINQPLGYQVLDIHKWNLEYL